MKKAFIWIKNNWTDPVWSKVFAGIILAFLALLVSWAKKIPIVDLFTKSINTYIKVNILTLLVILAFLIPMFLMDIIHVQLKHLKFPKKYKSDSFDLQDYLKGFWLLKYENNQGLDGKEVLKVENGNQYFINNQLVFVLKDINFDNKNKTIFWSKTRYDNNMLHARESLQIINQDVFIGRDSIGYNLEYTRLREFKINPGSIPPVLSHVGRDISFYSKHA